MVALPEIVLAICVVKYSIRQLLPESPGLKYSFIYLFLIFFLPQENILKTWIRIAFINLG